MTIEDAYVLISKLDEDVDMPDDDARRIRMIGLSRVLRIKLKALEEMLAEEIQTNG